MDGSHRKVEEEGSLLKVLMGKFNSKRSVEKPRTKWEDTVQREALRILWKKRAEDTEEWRSCLREVRAQNEL